MMQLLLEQYKKSTLSGSPNREKIIVKKMCIVSYLGHHITVVMWVSCLGANINLFCRLLLIFMTGWDFTLQLDIVLHCI